MSKHARRRQARVGERRRYDERLAMFLLRAHASDRYGRWRDTKEYKRGDPDGAAYVHSRTLKHLAEDVTADAAGHPRPKRRPFHLVRDLDDPAVIAADEEARAAVERAKQEAAERYLDELGDQAEWLGVDQAIEEEEEEAADRGADDRPADDGPPSAQEPGPPADEPRHDPAAPPRPGPVDGPDDNRFWTPLRGPRDVPRIS